MANKTFNVIEVIEVVDILGRAGQKAGKTNVARLSGVTTPRASRMLRIAVDLGLVMAYKDQYRANVARTCYGITETGKTVIGAVASHPSIYMLGGI